MIPFEELSRALEAYRARRDEATLERGEITDRKNGPSGANGRSGEAASEIDISDTDVLEES
jgi:hypothetical protein